MSRRAALMLLSPEERATLEAWARARSLPPRVGPRAQTVLRAGAGNLRQEIERRLGVSRPPGQLWREGFWARRLPGLKKDAPRAGRRPRRPARKVRAVVEATRHTRPPRHRRGLSPKVEALIAAIHEYLSNHNQRPQVFVWSEPVERIPAKLAKCREAADALPWKRGVAYRGDRRLLRVCRETRMEIPIPVVPL